MRPLFGIAILVTLLLPVSSSAQSQKSIAITIDDLPLLSRTPATISEMETVNQRMTSTLRSRGVPAIGFVNEDRLQRPGEVDRAIAVLDGWLEQGLELGNHNFGHLGLWASTLQEVEDAVVKGEVVTRRLAAAHGTPLRYYRHPFTQTGRDAEEKRSFESFLASRGYTVAPFTIEHDDYLYACVYDRVGDPAARRKILDEYRSHLEVSVEVFEAMTQQLFGRQIPQILLIHDTRLNAEALPALLDVLADRGYRFINLEEALRDPAYRLPDEPSGRYGPSWIARWARAAGKKVPPGGQPDPSDSTAALAKAVCADP